MKAKEENLLEINNLIDLPSEILDILDCQELLLVKGGNIPPCDIENTGTGCSCPVKNSGTGCSC